MGVLTMQIMAPSKKYVHLDPQELCPACEHPLMRHMFWNAQFRTTPDVFSVCNVAMSRDSITGRILTDRWAQEECACRYLKDALEAYR